MKNRTIQILLILLVVPAWEIALAQSGDKASRQGAMMKTLEAGKESDDGEKFLSRGQGTRSLGDLFEGETREVFMTRGLADSIMSARGVAVPLEATDEEESVELRVTTAPDANPDEESKGDLSVGAGKEAVKISYKVEPKSQLEGQINFKKGTDEIIGLQSYQFLADLSDVLNSDGLKSDTFIIEGHASADGPALTNQELSQKRANAIFKVLHDGGKGIPASRIFPVGVGEQRARVPEGAPEESLSRDRRVLIVRVK